MLAKRFTLEESATYDYLTDEQVKEMLNESGRSEICQHENVQYHSDKKQFDPDNEVKIRLLYSKKLENSKEGVPLL